MMQTMTMTMKMKMILCNMLKYSPDRVHLQSKLKAKKKKRRSITSCHREYLFNLKSKSIHNTHVHHVLHVLHAYMTPSPYGVCSSIMMSCQTINTRTCVVVVVVVVVLAIGKCFLNCLRIVVVVVDVVLTKRNLQHFIQN